MQVMDHVTFMNRAGDSTDEFDPTDSDSVAKMKSKVDALLRKGYWLLGKHRDDGRIEVITKDQIDDEKYSSILLSRNYKKLVQPAPTGG